jgi:hypothetical protein
VHEALFASFLPVNELADDAGMTALLAGARDSLWTIVSGDPQLRALEGELRRPEELSRRMWNRLCK